MGRAWQTQSEVRFDFVTVNVSFSFLLFFLLFFFPFFLKVSENVYIFDCDLLEYRIQRMSGISHS